MTMRMRPAALCWVMIVAAISVALPTVVYAETADKPSIDLPNPYAAGVKFGQIPEGRKWGGVIAVAPDRDGKSIWAFERCGGSCLEFRSAGGPRIRPRRQADQELWRRHVRVPARHRRRQGGQRLCRRR